MRLPLIAAVLSCLLIACSSQVIEFPTPLPTATPFVLPSPLPTVTPAPTTTPVSVEFPTPLPTATPFALPSPLPTSTPAPTATPVSFEFPTPLPTATPFAPPLPLPTPFASAFSGLDNLARVGVARISVNCTGFISHGTAWHIRTDKDDGYLLLSALHVVQPPNCEGPVWTRHEQIIWPQEANGYAIHIVAKSEEFDLVLVRIFGSPGDDLTQWLHKWDLAGAPDPVLGDEVRHITTRDLREEARDPLEIVPFVSEGVVAWADGEVLLTNTSSIGGESGGLIVDSKLEAVGLINRTGQTLPRQEGGYRNPAGLTTYSTPATAIRQFLIEAGYLNP